MAGATGQGAWGGMGWGHAEHLPRPPTLGPNLEGTWRGGRAEEGHRRRRHPGTRGKGGGAPGLGRRCGGAGGKAEESRLSHPTPTLQAAPHLLARPLVAYHRKGHQTRPPARGAPPSRRPSLPSFPSRAARVEERLTIWAGGGEATARLLELTMLMILPQAVSSSVYNSGIKL